MNLVMFNKKKVVEWTQELEILSIVATYERVGLVEVMLSHFERTDLSCGVRESQIEFSIILCDA